MEKTPRQNRVKDTLGKIYDHHPPYFREYLRRYEEDPTSRVFAPLAEAYRRLGRIDDAIKLCNDGLEYHPDFYGGRVTLAKCYLDKKMYVEARTELERVIQFVPENLLAQRLLGDVYALLKQKEAALHCYKMALLLSPTDVSLAERVHALEKSEDEEDDFLTNILKQPVTGTHHDEDPHDHDEVTETSTRTLDLRAAKQRQEQAAESEFEVVDRVALDESDDLPPLWEVHGPGEGKAKAKVTPDQGVDIDTLLGSKAADNEDGYRVEHVSGVFSDRDPNRKQEITTETLGDLYFSQGQFDKSLAIFEKLAERNHSPEMAKKVNSCRARLGVDRHSLLRNRQIKVLRSILKTVQAQKS